MGKLLAMFDGLTIELPCEVYGLNLRPTKGYRAFIVQEYDTHEEEKQAMGRIEALRCHLVLSAYFLGEDVHSVYAVSTWREGELPQVGSVDVPTPFERLRCNLPENPQPTVRTVVWFAKYLQCTEDKQKLFCLYNAFGMMFGEFDGVAKHFAGTAEEVLTIHFLEKIKEYQREDSQREDELYISTLIFTKEQIEKLEYCYIRCLKQRFFIKK